MGAGVRGNCVAVGSAAQELKDRSVAVPSGKADDCLMTIDER